MDALGNLNKESKSRVRLAAELMSRHSNAILISSGGNNKMGIDTCIGNQIAAYAIQLGVPSNKIITDTLSQDTVGDALFTKINMVLNKNWKNILVVTSDYHVNRSQVIFDFIYGPQYTIEVVGCTTEIQKERAPLESKSLNQFTSTFSNIASGDHENILKRLLTDHPYYNK
jgi:vancomycin permeability regulator SanA